MEAAMMAIETTGTVDEVPLAAGVEEDEWLRATARNPVFHDLESPQEDIYSLEDGDPSIDQV